jgi:hypothetical protein
LYRIPFSGSDLEVKSSKDERADVTSTPLYLNQCGVVEVGYGVKAWTSEMAGCEGRQKPRDFGVRGGQKNSPKKRKIDNDVPVLNQFDIHKFLSTTHEIRDLNFEFGF